MSTGRAGRRGRNEGNIYKRADGRWTARLHLGYDLNGRRVRKSYYGRTRQEVQEALTRGLSEVASGAGPRRDERETVTEFLASWLRNTVEPSARPSTFRTYEYLIRVHIAPALGRNFLTKLDVREVQAFLNAKASEGLSPQTVGHMRAVLRAALNDALRWGLIHRNAASLADPPRIPRKAVIAMSPEDARRIVVAVQGDRLEAVYVLALASGLRQGEVLGLHWSDVDLDSRTLTVQGALQRVGGRLVVVEPKTERSRRKVALPNVAVDALRSHRVRQLNERLVAGTGWQGSDLIFTTAMGNPLDGVNVTHHLHSLMRASGLPEIRFHDLRHGCASLLLAQGVHPRVVMEVLGHSQIALTMNTYSHVIPSLQTDAAERLDAALSGLATG